MSDETQGDVFESRSSGPRFSLRRLFRFVTLVVLVLTVVRLGYEVVVLRKEVVQLRSEAGHLVVDAGYKDRIQAIGVPQYEDKTWKWKVYLPPGRSYTLKVKWNDIPVFGLPEGRASRIYPIREEVFTRSDSQEFILNCALRKAAGSENWEFIKTLSIGDDHRSAHRGAVNVETQGWLEESLGSSFQGVDDAHSISSDEKSLVLMRRRQMERTSPTSSQIPNGPAKGLMIWIEEVDPNDPNYFNGSISYE